MRPELQAYLDGEVRLEELPPELHEAAKGWELLLSEIDADQEAGPVPAFVEARVMAEILGSDEAPASTDDRAGGPIPWLLRPREIRVSPLTGLLAAAAIAFLMLAPWRDAPMPLPGGSVAESTIYVQFRLEAPSARSVAVSGDFNEWGDGQELTDHDGDGIWTGRIAVQPGIHEYMFVIDGDEWVTPPDADGYRDDGFGSRNGVVTVLPAA